MYFYIYNVEWNAAYVSNVEEHLLHHGQSVFKAVLDYNGGHENSDNYHVQVENIRTLTNVN